MWRVFNAIDMQDRRVIALKVKKNKDAHFNRRIELSVFSSLRENEIEIECRTTLHTTHRTFKVYLARFVPPDGFSTVKKKTRFIDRKTFQHRCRGWMEGAGGVGKTARKRARAQKSHLPRMNNSTMRSFWGRNRVRIVISCCPDRARQV